MINAKYTLQGTVIQNVDKIKYLGVTTTDDFKMGIHQEKKERK